jgi:quercetin dioxygenase-like cupin family protein
MWKSTRTQQRVLAHAGLTALLLGTAAIVSAQAPVSQQAFTWTADDPGLEWGPCPEFMPEGCALAVLQGDPGKHNADVFFKLPGGTTAPHHWHTSAERMVLITGEMVVDYDDQDPVILRPGTYAYGPATLAHTTVCRSADPCILFIAFEEPVDALPTRAH